MTGRGSPKTGGLSALLSKGDQDLLRKIISESVKESVKELLTPIANQVNELEKSHKKLDKNVKDLNVKMEACETTTQKAKQTAQTSCKQMKVYDQVICSLAWESSQRALRLQGLVAPEKEELKDVVTKLLAPLAEMPEVELYKQIQAVYRVETQYTKRNELPGETHIKFGDKETRDRILIGANKNPVEYAGEKIKIVKEIPFIVRQKRLEFKPLTKQLINKNISFKWLFPQGIQFFYKKQLVRLTTKNQLDRFLERNGEDFKKEQATPAAPETKEPDKKKQEKKKQEEKMELRARKGSK